MKKKLVYVVGGATNYISWLRPLGYQETEDRREACLFYFTGGCDLSPTLYGEKSGSYTYSDFHRDEREKRDFDYAVENKIKMCGACLGFQRLGVLGIPGAKMVQHSVHPGEHLVKFPYHNNKEIQVPSTHHQQLLLDQGVTGLVEGQDYLLLAYTEKLSPFHLNGDDKDYKFPEEYREPEGIFVPNKGILSFQTHLEFLRNDHPSVLFCQEVFQEYLE